MTTNRRPHAGGGIHYFRHVFHRSIRVVLDLVLQHHVPQREVLLQAVSASEGAAGTLVVLDGSFEHHFGALSTDVVSAAVRDEDVIEVL